MTGLSSRFAPPRIVHTLVARADFFAQLNNALGVITVLSGPPGSGCTTLMGSCYQSLAQLKEPVRWINLSYADNDPLILQAHLQEAFTPEQNLLGDFPERVSGFIDGVGWLDNPHALNLLERFVLTVPVTSRIVLCTGRLKLKQLASAQLSGLVRVFGVKYLHLTDAEAGELLGDGLSYAQARQLNTFVDGWPAGLRFFANDPDACASFLQHKLGPVRLPQGMADYIEAQFAQKLNAAQLDALMELSVLQRFIPELLVDLPEPWSHWALVENFLSDGWTVRYLDSHQHWCEVNPALASYFAQRLKRFHPARFQALKLFTVNWLNEHNYPQEAARHAASLDKPSVAASVLEQAGPMVLDLGTGPKVELPELLAVEQAEQYPLVFIGQLYARIRAGKLSEASTLFEQAWQLTNGFSRTNNPDDSEEVQSWGIIYRYVFKFMQDAPIADHELVDLQQHMDRWLIKEPVMAAGWASLLAYGLCEARQYERAVLICNNALKLSQLQAQARISVFLWIHQSVATLALGQLDEAINCAEQACLIAQQEDPASYEQVTANLWRAVVYFYQNQHAKALSLLTQVLGQISQTSGWVPMYAHGYAVAVECACLSEDFTHAKQLITHGERFAQMRGLRRLSAYLVIVKLNYLVRTKAWREALQLHASDSFVSLMYSAPTSPYEWSTHVLATLISAQLMLELGRPAQALDYLEQLDGEMLKCATCAVQISIALLKARAYFSVRRYSLALTCACQVYELASTSRFSRPIGLDYQALEEVLSWAKNRGKPLPEGLWTWFSQFVRAVDNTQTIHKGQQLLSPRESEVLLLVAEGLTNKEVAQRLKIAEGTVKGHRKRIHEKLKVNSRSQAINKARELLLI